MSDIRSNLQKFADAYSFGYQGMEKDAETGFNNFDLRMYDARYARWFNVDPMGQFHSPYISMGNNPISKVDPNGGWIDDSGLGFDYGPSYQQFEYPDNWYSMDIYERSDWLGANGYGNAVDPEMQMGSGGAGLDGDRIDWFRMNNNDKRALSSALGGNLNYHRYNGTNYTNREQLEKAIEKDRLEAQAISTHVTIMVQQEIHASQLIVPRISAEIDWDEVANGAVGVISGAGAIIGGVALSATVAGAPAGAALIIGGIPAVGFGAGAIVDGFQGGTRIIPGGLGEGIDRGFGGDGTYGQIADIAFGGRPTSYVDKAIFAYDVYNTNVIQNMIASPATNQASSLNMSMPRDNTNVNMSVPVNFRKY